MKHLTSTPIRARTALCILAGSLAGLAACEDPGVVIPPTEAPRITSFTVSTDRPVEGEAIGLTVVAEGPRLIESVRFVFTGAMEKDTVVTVPTPRDEVTLEASIDIPLGTGPDSTAQVAVTAIDEEGEVSELPGVVALIIEDATPPSATTTTQVTSVAGGGDFQVRVQASDNRGVRVIGVIREFQDVRDTVASDTSALAPPTRDRTFTVPAPDAQAGSFTVQGFATDITGLSSEAPTVQLSIIDNDGPVIDMSTDRPQYPLGDSVLVTANLSDPSGIESVTFVGIAVRGNPEFGEDEFVVRFPPRTVTYPRTQADTLFKDFELKHWLFTDDEVTADSMVLVIVTATDGVGNVSEAVDTISVGGPHVQILFPDRDPMHWATSTPGEVPNNLEVRVSVVDTDPILNAFLFVERSEDDFDQIPITGFTADVTERIVEIPIGTGEIEFSLRAEATSVAGLRGRTAPIRVVVSDEAALPDDTDPPVVSLQFEPRGTPVGSATRVEFTDSLIFTASAHDTQSGLQRIGLWALLERRVALPDGSDTTFVDTMRETLTFTTAPRNRRDFRVAFPTDSLYAIMGFDNPTVLDSLAPDTVRLKIFAFAEDTSGLLACAVGLGQQLPCEPATDDPDHLLQPVDVDPMERDLIAVRGNTLRLTRPGSVIADLAVDPVDERVFLSNITHNQVEPLQDHANPYQVQFLDPVLVGSQPWGLFIGRRVVGAEAGPGFGAAGDTVRTLLVANSGGTNMSLVNLHADPQFLQEAAVVRVGTPNSVIYEIGATRDEAGNLTYTGEFFDFSDRPQFVAQDSLMRLVYSTVPTNAANTATVRYGVMDPDPTSTSDSVEVRMLVMDFMVESATDVFAVANVTRVNLYGVSADSDSIEFIINAPGYPSDRMSTGLHMEIRDAELAARMLIDSVMTERGIPEQAPLYYPFVMRGRWDFNRLGMSDTTFIAASTDGGRIVIGEGAAAPTGRIMMWHADPCDPVTLTCATTSSSIEIMDLVHNASERVLGVGLNANGTLGVARGHEATYFFTPDLRLQGLFQQQEQGGAGASFHPDHSSHQDGAHMSPEGVAFTGTSNRSIEVVNTFHFNLIRTLGIRDNIVGPLRAGPRLTDDDADVVARLYGITDVGGVVTIKVRERDLEQ